MKLQTMPLRFRVWDKKEKKFLLEDADLDEYASLWAGAGVGGEDEVISQDTGCKDDVGEPLYMGDIVEDRMSMSPFTHECPRGIVCYNGYANAVEYSNGLEDSMFCSTRYHKLGNIWQNQELVNRDGQTSSSML